MSRSEHVSTRAKRLKELERESLNVWRGRTDHAEVRGLRMELRAQSKAGQRIVEAPEGSQPDAQGVGTVMAASAT